MNCTQKKGQVTIFVVVAIIIVLLLFVIYYYGNLSKSIQKETIAQAQINPIKNSIDNCLSSTLIDAVRIIGLQGGYLNPPTFALKTNSSTIAYGYYERKNVLVSNKKIEEEVSTAIELFLPLCFDKTEFNEFEIETSIPKAKTKISENFISAEVDFPIIISKGELSFNLDKKYYSELNLNLKKIINFIKTIIEAEIKNPDYLDLTSLTNSDYDIAILPIDEKVSIYSITDSNQKIEDMPFTFIYAKRK